MSAPGSFHDLVVGPADTQGRRSPDVDPLLCADIARTAAQLARAWAADSAWTGLGGFDHGGGFWLGPETPATPETLVFLRTPRSAGWLGPAEPANDDPVARRLPSARFDPDEFGPLHFPVLESRLRELAGFGGCALRHPATGFWKPVVLAGDAARLNVATRAFAPLSRVLASQGLPVGRLLITSARSAALVWRTPGKIFGYLHLDSLADLGAAAALVEQLNLCTAHAARD